MPGGILTGAEPLVLRLSAVALEPALGLVVAEDVAVAGAMALRAAVSAFHSLARRTAGAAVPGLFRALMAPAPRPLSAVLVDSEFGSVAAGAPRRRLFVGSRPSGGFGWRRRGRRRGGPLDAAPSLAALHAGPVELVDVLVCIHDPNDVQLGTDCHLFEELVSNRDEHRFRCQAFVRPAEEELLFEVAQVLVVVSDRDVARNCGVCVVNPPHDRCHLLRGAGGDVGPKFGENVSTVPIALVRWIKVCLLNAGVLHRLLQSEVDEVVNRPVALLGGGVPCGGACSLGPRWGLRCQPAVFLQRRVVIVGQL